MHLKKLNQEKNLDKYNLLVELLHKIAKFKILSKNFLIDEFNYL